MIVHRAVSLRMGAWGMCVSLCLHTHRGSQKGYMHYTVNSF